MDLNERIKDFDERIKLSLQKGGLGNATFDYNESPTTQTYTQAAASGLNSGYNQMLADIHRFGDIQRADYNMKLKGLNAGLENQYKEELRDKEFNNELKKLQYTHDLAMKKYEKVRQDQLDDIERERQLQHDLNTPQFVPTNGKPHNFNLTSYDALTGVRKNQEYIEPVIEFAPDVQAEYDEFLQQNPTLKYSLNNENVAEYLSNYIVNKYSDYKLAPRRNALLASIQQSKLKAQENLIKSQSNPTLEPRSYGDVLDAMNSRNGYYGENILRNDVSGMLSNFLQGFDPERKRLLEYYAGINRLHIVPPTEYKNNDFVYELYKTIQNTPAEELARLGFVNTNGMQEKIILRDERLGEYLVTEPNSDILIRFTPVGFDGNNRPILKSFGKVSYKSTVPSINDYKHKGLMHKAGEGLDTLANKAGEYANNPTKLLKDINNFELYKFKNDPSVTVGNSLEKLFNLGE
jgi:hypothetical protein